MSDIPTWVRRGQKVVCLGDDVKVAVLSKERGLGEQFPVHGGIYTIRSTFFAASGELCIRLVEITNKKHRYIGGLLEVGFEAKSFEPLVDDANTSEVEAEMFRARPRSVSAPRGRADA
jgi:hypothetical protein